MTQSSSKKYTNKTLDEPFISVKPDGEMDELFIAGKYVNESYYPTSDICYMGISDGTLIRYDYNSSKKITVVKQGSCVISEKYDSNMYSAYVIVDDEKIDWTVCGEIH